MICSHPTGVYIVTGNWRRRAFPAEIGLILKIGPFRIFFGHEISGAAFPHPYEYKPAPNSKSIKKKYFLGTLPLKTFYKTVPSHGKGDLAVFAGKCV